jgi:hypothetical protein
MRAADTVCTDRDRSGASSLRLISEGRDGWEDRTYRLSADDAVLAYDGGTVGTAFAYLGGARYSDAWKTITTLARVGDELTVRWTFGNDNDYLRDAGLHHDSVALILAHGTRRIVLPLEDSITPDNSARMLRP